MSFRELRKEIKHQLSMNYVYYVWALFTVNLVLNVYLVYLLLLYYITNIGASPYSVLTFLYSNMLLTVAIEIVGFAFIGAFAFVIFRLLQSLKVHKEKLISVLSSADMPNISESVNEIRNLKVPGALLPAIFMVFFYFVPPLEIVSIILAFYYIYRSHIVIKSFEKLEEKAYAALGIKLERKKTQDHNFALYFIITIITLGLFMLYLIHEIVSEFNRHVSEDYRMLESVEF